MTYIELYLSNQWNTSNFISATNGIHQTLSQQPMKYIELYLSNQWNTYSHTLRGWHCQLVLYEMQHTTPAATETRRYCNKLPRLTLWHYRQSESITASVAKHYACECLCRHTQTETDSQSVPFKFVHNVVLVIYELFQYMLPHITHIHLYVASYRMNTSWNGI